VCTREAQLGCVHGLMGIMRALLCLGLCLSLLPPPARGDEEPPPPLGCPDGARDVLMDLWTATDGEVSWRDNEGWASDEPCCGWFGVTCDSNSSAVTTLRLANNRLRGTLPDSLGSLGEGVEQLIIYGNSPGRDGACFQPSHGCLTGTIPATLNLLTGMQKLYLHYNVMSGTVPSLRNMVDLDFIHL
jgi:hypothetical protein